MADSDIDIVKLTNLAETGHGCDLQDQLRQMPFEESLKALKQIETQSAEDRGRNSALHPLYFSSNGGGYSAYAELYRADPGSSLSWGDQIFEDRLGIDNGSGH